MQQTPTRHTEVEITGKATRVRVIGYTYLVDFGPNTQPRFHTVNKQRRCSCELGAGCSAIEAVKEYLRNGGERAPDPMLPCPICGSSTVRDKAWDGKYTREPGWRCEEGGLSHFLQAKARRIQEALRQKAACQTIGKQEAASGHEGEAGR